MELELEESARMFPISSDWAYNSVAYDLVRLSESEEEAEG